MADIDFPPGMLPTALNDLQIYLLSRENRTAAKHKLIRAAFAKRQWNVIVAQVLSLDAIDMSLGVHKLVHACEEAHDSTSVEAILARWSSLAARGGDASPISHGKLLRVVADQARAINQVQADLLLEGLHFQNIPAAIDLLAARAIIPSPEALQRTIRHFDDTCFFDGIRQQMAGALARLHARQIEKALEGARPTRSDVQVDGAGL